MEQREFIDEIYERYDYAPPNSAEDFLDWGIRQGMAIDDALVRLYEAHYCGEYESLEQYANGACPPEVTWQDLVEAGFWQGDYSDVVFGPDKEFG